MRLDAFLKISRLVPRRSEAGDLCREGKVFIDDLPAKAGRAVRPGQRIRIEKPARELTVVVAAVPVRKAVSKAAARELYDVEDERRFDFWGREIVRTKGDSPD